MKRQPCSHVRRDDAVVAGSVAAVEASALPLRSGKLARDFWFMFGSMVVLGLIRLPATAQDGSLTDSSTQSDAQRPMAQAIDTMCPQLESGSDLSQVCTPMVTGSSDLSQDELNAATQSLNGEETQAMQQQVGSVGATQVANVTARMDMLRAGLTSPGLSVAGLTLGNGEQILPAGYEESALAGEEDASLGEGGTLGAPIWDKVGVFVTGGGSFGDKSKSGQITGYDFYTVGLTAGADYSVRDDLAVGGAVGYSYYNADFDTDQNNASGQDLDTNSVIFSLFGTYFPTEGFLAPLEGFFLDGMASFGWSFFDMSRHVVVPSNNPAEQPVNERANSDTTAFQYGFAGNVGYEFNVRQFTITPVGRVRYVKADIDGYEESGADPVNLKVGSQDATSLTTHLGASLGYALSTQYGVIEPTIRGEYVHEFENNDGGAGIRYASDPTGASAFDVITERPNRNYGIVGAALTGTFAGGWSAFTDFETVVDLGRFDVYTFRVGARRQF